MNYDFFLLCSQEHMRAGMINCESTRLGLKSAALRNIKAKWSNQCFINFYFTDQFT